MVAALSVLVTLAHIQTPSPLDQIEKDIHTAAQKQPADTSAMTAANDAILHLIETDQLKTGGDFLRASKDISYLRIRFDIARVKHELVLAALASGEEGARKAIKQTWDALLLSTGRYQRIGSFKFDSAGYTIAPAPKSIFNVINDPAHAIEATKTAKNDEEMTRICDEDQKDRKIDWSKLKAAEMNEIGKRDRARMARTLELLDAGRVVSAEDFAHASLVLQHGTYWNDYCLAHELSICSLILGDTDNANLAAATYDRMIESAGFHQRFATQYTSLGAQTTLDPVDTNGIGDNVRKAMHCPTLEQAKNRKWD